MHTRTLAATFLPPCRCDYDLAQGCERKLTGAGHCESEPLVLTLEPLPINTKPTGSTRAEWANVLADYPQGSAEAKFVAAEKAVVEYGKACGNPNLSRSAMRANGYDFQFLASELDCVAEYVADYC